MIWIADSRRLQVKCLGHRRLTRDQTLLEELLRQHWWTCLCRWFLWWYASQRSNWWINSSPLRRSSRKRATSCFCQQARLAICAWSWRNHVFFETWRDNRPKLYYPGLLCNHQRRLVTNLDLFYWQFINIGLSDGMEWLIKTISDLQAAKKKWKW